MVCLDESTHSAKLIFELVDVFGGDNAVEAGEFVAYPMRVSYALEAFDASDIVLHL
jgi:hypothetical protein